MKIANFLLVVALLTGISAVASAAPVCMNGIDIISGTMCSLGDLTFTFMAPGFSPTSTGDSLTITSAAINGSDVVLQFGINPGTAGFPVDVNINYAVASTSSDITGIDASFPALTSGQISEQACSMQPAPATLCTAPNTLSALVDTTGGAIVTGTPATFGPVSTVYIHKDIDAINFSEFTDSIMETSTVPEPSTAGLLGLALCGLGLLQSKIRRR
jgi:hypothetical protein